MEVDGSAPAAEGEDEAGEDAGKVSTSGPRMSRRESYRAHKVRPSLLVSVLKGSADERMVHEGISNSYEAQDALPGTRRGQVDGVQAPAPSLSLAALCDRVLCTCNILAVITF